MNNKRYLVLIRIISIVVPLLVAFLLFFPTKLSVGDWVYYIPPFNAFINTLTSILLIGALIAIKNKNIIHFLRNNPNLNICIRLFDSVVTSKNDMKIYEHKVIGKGKKIINISFHKSYIKKKSFYHCFWLKNINNIQKKI